MVNKFTNLGFLIVITLILSQCANKGTTSGGDKDVTPPVIIKSTPENFSINFDAQEIEIEFDEYVKLKNLQKQLIISPPMTLEPEITPVGTASKIIKIKIFDTLQPNTTYAFNFGESIADNNEGNLFPYYKYIFSTGTYIDSLSVSGMVSDALNKEVDERVAVLLYEVDSSYYDSIVYKQKPKYITVTDSLSGFKLENLKEGSYLLTALKEENPNYTYQQKTDKIAYRKQFISVPSDTAYVLRLFKESIDYDFKRARQASKNKIAFGYEGEGTSMRIKILSEVPDDFSSTITKEIDKDTLNYWYRPEIEVDSLLFEVRHLESIDTAVVRIKDFKLDSLMFKPLSSKLKLQESLLISASTPLGKFKASKVQVMDKDSVFQTPTMGLDASLNAVVLDFDKTEKNNYSIQLLPGALTDFYGVENDTLNYKVATKLQSDYGNVRITIRNGVYPLIVQLTEAKGEEVESQMITEATPVDFKDVNPGIYSLRVIFDTNKNGVYDTGSFLNKTQPERVSYASKPVEIRAAWDTFEEFVLED
tara:strand:- start:40252 stop:41853 length:1602 start_codon:yes stop_codon:yes gene_type:complete